MRATRTLSKVFRYQHRGDAQVFIAPKGKLDPERAHEQTTRLLSLWSGPRGSRTTRHHRWSRTRLTKPDHDRGRDQISHDEPVARLGGPICVQSTPSLHEPALQPAEVLSVGVSKAHGAASMACVNYFPAVEISNEVPAPNAMSLFGNREVSES